MNDVWQCNLNHINRAIIGFENMLRTAIREGDKKRVAFIRKELHKAKLEKRRILSF